MDLTLPASYFFLLDMLKTIKRLFIAVVLAGLGLVASVAWWSQKPLAMTLAEGQTVLDLRVPPKSTAMSVAKALNASGVDTSARLLFEWFRWSGQARDIKAGSYELAPGITPTQLLDVLVQGKQALRRVTFIEGWTFKQVRAALAQAPDLEPVTASWSDARIMAALGRGAQHPEGRFFPDTYVYPKHGDDIDVLRQAANHMDTTLAAVWAKRSARTPVDTPAELLTLASIIEKETNHNPDRPLVAGVFANRLRIGMRLQTDPTVIYGLGDSFDGNLRRDHLRADTPYNSYTRAGLPPTPIAMPGEASLKAALAPATTDALYFVAKGNGTSAFSNSLAQHNRAVQRYIFGR
ncbi:MAG: endolytic transglycosylase MltG [Burkholderiaceae bacterium]|nr:endolytic transglycosylase MltG [Burkholderiaceae bacterium]